MTRNAGRTAYYSRASFEDRRITQDDYNKKARELKERQAEIALHIEQHQQGDAEYRTRFIFRFDGEMLRAAAAYNVGTEIKEFVYRNPIAPGRYSISARAALERRTVHVPDVQADTEFAYG